jgi:SsrA-binding protein
MVEVTNKKAYFDYFVLKEIECGIVLTGTEIKSIRKGSVNLRDTYARIKNNEVYVVNMFISAYDKGNQFNHDERRQRKLLLHKKEIIKLSQEIKEQGLTLVPLKLYFKDNHAKLLIGLCKGKKLYDKRETIKKRDIERDSRY